MKTGGRMSLPSQSITMTWIDWELWRFEADNPATNDIQDILDRLDRGIVYASVPYLATRFNEFNGSAAALDWAIENRTDPWYVDEMKAKIKLEQAVQKLRAKREREYQMSESATTSADKPKRSGNVKGTHAMIARARAVKILEARHQTEFDQILGDEREKIGLPRKSGNDKRVVLLKRLDAQEKKLAELRKQLEALTDTTN